MPSDLLAQKHTTRKDSHKHDPTCLHAPAVMPPKTVVALMPRHRGRHAGAPVISTVPLQSQAVYSHTKACSSDKSSSDDGRVRPSRSSSFDTVHSGYTSSDTSLPPSRLSYMIDNSSPKLEEELRKCTADESRIVCTTALLMKPPTEVGMSFSKFRLLDKKPLAQREAMSNLVKINKRLRMEKKVDEHLLQSSKARKRDLIKIKALELRSRRKASGVEVESPSELKKTKNPSTCIIFHDLYLAIRDRDVRQARGLVERLPSGSLRKKPNSPEHRQANQCFLAAMAARMEGVVLLMIFKGFPSDFCAPIFTSETNQSDKRQKEALSDFVYPNYFLLAASFGLVHVVRCMMRHAHVNQGWFGLTPLMAAITHPLPDNDTEMVKILLDAGADPNQGILMSQLGALCNLQQNHKDREGDEKSGYMRVLPLDIACAMKDEEFVLMLLQKMDSASVAQSKFSLIAQQTSPLITALLLVAGANCHQTDFKGNTSLHLAAAKGDLIITALLLHAGIPLDSKGEDNLTALDLALKHNQIQVANYLRSQNSTEFKDLVAETNQQAYEYIQEAVHYLCSPSGYSSSSSSHRSGEVSRPGTPDPLGITSPVSPTFRKEGRSTRRSSLSSTLSPSSPKCIVKDTINLSTMKGADGIDDFCAAMANAVKQVEKERKGCEKKSKIWGALFGK